MSNRRIEPLGKAHDRGSFDCGEPTLNVFLQRHAGQNARRDISRTYVAVSPGGRVDGYYTLSTGSISFEDTPSELTQRLPRYPLPVAHLGRLAVDRRSQGQGLGGFLLVDALKRVRDLAENIGICAVTVHALNDRAAKFYQAHGFIELLDDPHHLLLPMQTIRQL